VFSSFTEATQYNRRCNEILSIHHKEITMKQMNIAVRYSVLILVLLSMTLPAYTQDGKATREDKKEQRQGEKEQRKILKQQIKEKAAKKTSVIVDSKRFILEVNYMKVISGNRVAVNPGINFVLVNSNVATLQMGSASSLGKELVGGQIVTGQVTIYEVMRSGRDEKNYSINMKVNTFAGPFDILFTISETGNADASIRGVSPKALHVYGKLVSLEETTINKGGTIY